MSKPSTIRLMPAKGSKFSVNGTTIYSVFPDDNTAGTPFDYDDGLALLKAYPMDLSVCAADGASPLEADDPTALNTILKEAVEANVPSDLDNNPAVVPVEDRLDTVEESIESLDQRVTALEEGDETPADDDQNTPADDNNQEG